MLLKKLPDAPASGGGKPTARLATLTALMPLIAENLSPMPKRRTLARWFTAAGVRSFKPSPHAAKGGGEIYWFTADVERFIRALPGGTRTGGEEDAP